MAGIPFSTAAAIEPAIAWRFRLILPTFSNSGSASSGDVVVVRPSPVKDLACAFSVNPRSISSEQAYMAASHRAFPTEYNVDALNIRFVESKGFGVMRFFRDWQKRVISPQGYFGLPKDYKRDVTVTPLDTKGADAVSLTYADCWPTTLASFELDGTQLGFVLQTVTLACDNSNEPE